MYKGADPFLFSLYHSLSLEIGLGLILCGHFFRAACREDGESIICGRVEEERQRVTIACLVGCVARACIAGRPRPNGYLRIKSVVSRGRPLVVGDTCEGLSRVHNECAWHW
eukprot:4899095-Pleurochrysis_carterae.AAC.1